MIYLKLIHISPTFVLIIWFKAEDISWWILLLYSRNPLRGRCCTFTMSAVLPSSGHMPELHHELSEICHKQLVKNAPQEGIWGTDLALTLAPTALPRLMAFLSLCCPPEDGESTEPTPRWGVTDAADHRAAGWPALKVWGLCCWAMEFSNMPWSTVEGKRKYMIKTVIYLFIKTLNLTQLGWWQWK